MKQILCLIDSLGMGGAERQMTGLVLLLKQKGYKVDLVKYYSHNVYAELLQNYGINSKTLKVSNSRWSKIRSIQTHIKEVGGYDCIIAYKDGPTVIGCLMKLLGGKFKLIVSERNTNQSIRRKDRLKFFLYRFADYVVPNSYSQEEFIKKHFPFLSKKIITISNFTDTDHFIPIETEKNSKFTVMTVARVAKQKNVLNYLKAIRILKDKKINVKFDWYGNIQTGEEAYGEKVYAQQKELDIEDMIIFHPATTDIAKHYQTCDVFCLPSIYEGFPNVICEAMSCGKPIICSRVCDNPRIVQENKNGIFFNPNDVEDIANQLISICNMSQKQLKTWGKKSREIGETLFSPKVFVNKYIELIEQIY